VADQGATRPPIFRGAIMKGVQLQGTPLADYGRSVRFKIDAAGADLRGAQLHGVNLSLFDLTAADLSYYEALPSDDASRSYMCDNALAMAACGAPLGRTAAAGGSPGLRPALLRRGPHRDGGNLDADREKSSPVCSSRAVPRRPPPAQCAGGPAKQPAAGADAPTAQPIDDCRTVIGTPPANGAHAVRGILTFLKQVADHPKAWCGQDAATADDRRPLYMRAFVHRIYDYRCQYRRALAAAGSADALASPGPEGETTRTELAADDSEIGKAAASIFAACGVDVAVFATDAWSASCNGAIPKTIP
jgi:hypothetical protein